MRKLKLKLFHLLLLPALLFCAPKAPSEAAGEAFSYEAGKYEESSKEAFSYEAGKYEESSKEAFSYEAGNYEESSKEAFSYEAGNYEESTENSSDPESADSYEYPQLSGEDIVRLDEGDAELIYNEEGRVTFIRGRYSPEKVENFEDAAMSLNYVSSLLGLQKGALLFCVYGGIDYTSGYRYYLFLQRDGDLTVINAAIKIYVDPDGYTAALSCSFNPATGIREESKGRIEKTDAERIVREHFPDIGFLVFEDATSMCGLMENDQNIHVWSVYSTNPAIASAGEESAAGGASNAGAAFSGTDMPYLQHLVSYDGEYLMNMPVSTVSSLEHAADEILLKKSGSYFEGMREESWTGEVSLFDERRVTLTVPVAYSEKDGRYYLMDLKRKIMVADYKEAVYGSGDLIISSSENNSGWNTKELFALYNLGLVYDYYADHGIRSVDGFGIPLLILSGACTKSGSGMDSTFFSGFDDGFGVFAVSMVNNDSECLDIMAHEYSHGISCSSMGGCYYVNAMGAINEAFSDIMGNLCELSLAGLELSEENANGQASSDRTLLSLRALSSEPDPVKADWRIGETGGRVYRNMADPLSCRQPAFVGDAFYCSSTQLKSSSGNDYGGVHENSSLLGCVAFKLDEYGLSLEQQYSLWMTAMNMMTPKSGYREMLEALIFARKSYGMDEKLDSFLFRAFAERGLLEDAGSQSGRWDKVSFTQVNAGYLMKNAANNLACAGSLNGWLDGVGLDSEGRIMRDGFGRLSLSFSEKSLAVLEGALIMEPGTFKALSVNCPDTDGGISFLLPEGSYILGLSVNRGGRGSEQFLVYSGSGSYLEPGQGNMGELIRIEAGRTLHLEKADIS